MLPKPLQNHDHAKRDSSRRILFDSSVNAPFFFLFFSNLPNCHIEQLFTYLFVILFV